MLGFGAAGPPALGCQGLALENRPIPALHVHDLHKRFGAVTALDGISFDVEPGEIFGYLGPNGAGKTTTLRVVLGLVRATSGIASVFGRAPSDPESRVSVGFVPGDLRLYGDMTAQAALDFFARFRPGRPPVLRDELITALDIDDATLGRRVKFLSHGTRQKIGLIAAMQHDPELLLLDEPSNGLDPLVQHTFREVVAGFARRGRAVVLSSHVLSEVEAMCGRVAIVRAGKIVALETIEALRGRVMRRLTVRFRGAPADLSSVPGVSRVEQLGPDTVMFVQGNPKPILAALAAADIVDVAFPEPQLEDVFLGFYNDA